MNDKRPSPERMKKKRTGIPFTSAVVNAVVSFTRKIYKYFSTSVLFAVLTSYNKIVAAFSDTLLGRAVKEKNGRASSVSAKVRYRFSKQLEGSVLLNLINNAEQSLLLMPLYYFGIMFFAFGFYVTIIYLFMHYALNSPNTEMISLIIGIIILAVSLPMMSVKKHLALVLSESGIYRTFFVGFLGFRSGKIDAAAEKEPVTGMNVMFIIGMLLGISTVFIPVYALLGLIGVLTALSITLQSPESALVCVILLLPFLPTMVLVAVIAVLVLSLLVKLFSGKRVLKYEFPDFLVSVFALFTFFGGVFTQDGSSFKKMLVFVCFILGYFIIRNFIRTEVMAKRCISAAVIASTVVSVLGIIEYFIGTPATTWQDTDAFSSIKGRIVSTFGNPNVLGEYLILILPVIFALLITAKAYRRRFALSLAFLLNLACLLLTWSRGAWLGFVIAFILFIAVVGYKGLAAGIFLIFPASAALVWLGGDVITRMTTLNDSSTSYRVNIWRGILKMLRDVFVSGIGTGDGAFAAVYPFYALSGIESAPHSHSLYLQIVTELGIFALVVFIIIIIMFSLMTFTFLSDAEHYGRRTVCLGLFCGIFAFLIQGLTDYVWYNYRVYLMFWLMFGIAVSFIAISGEEAVKAKNDYILMYDKSYYPIFHS